MSLISENDSYLLCSESASNEEDIYDLRNNGLLRNQRKKSTSISSLFSNRRSANIALSQLSKNLGIYANCVGTINYTKEFPIKEHGIRSLQISKNGEIIVVGFMSGLLQSLKLSDASLEKEFIKGGDISCPVTSIRFHPDTSFQNKFFASSANGKLWAFSTDEDDYKEILIEKNNEINAFDLNISGQCLITAGKDAAIRTYDVETCKLVKEYKKQSYNDNPEEKIAPFHRQRIFMVKCSPQCEHTYVSGGFDNLVKIWDDRSPSGCINTISGPHIIGQSLDLKNHTLLTGSFGGNGLQLWDFRMGKLLTSCNPLSSMRSLEGKFIFAAQFYNINHPVDIVLSANVGLPTLDVISVKGSLLLHAFYSSKQVSAIHSYEDIIAYSDIKRNLYIGKFTASKTINENVLDVGE